MQPLIRTVIRTISKQNYTDPTTDAWAVSDVNMHLTGFIQQGYRIAGTHYAGEMPEGYTMIYVLARDQEVSDNGQEPAKRKVGRPKKRETVPA